MILLDKHAAIWLATDQGLGKRSQRLIDKALADDSLAISAISFWELAMLVAKRRLRALKPAADQRSKMLSGGYTNCLSPARSQFSQLNLKTSMAIRRIASSLPLRSPMTPH